MIGSISGGWAYVYGAYAVTWIVLGGYALSLMIRRPQATHIEEDRS